MVRFIHIVILSMFFGSCGKQEKITVIEKVKNTLCGKQVVLLGEGNNHGEGTTEAFKAELVQTLVENCDFELLLFEASFYQFSKINANYAEGLVTQEAEMKAALGGLWGYDQETQGLVKFITKSLNAGNLTVGGIDDQLSRRRQDYANYEMPKDVSKGLEPAIAELCRAALDMRITFQFPKDDPYSPAKKKQLQDCFSATSDSSAITAMRASLSRAIARDFDSPKDQMQGRALSMFQNFEHWFGSAPKPPKTIIWSATVHASKKGTVYKPNLGEHVHRRFGDRAFTLGFSALTGSHRKMSGLVKPLPEAPENSLEALAMSKTDRDSWFLDQQDLIEFGVVSGAAITNSYQTENWSDLLDGIVIFRQQMPVTRLPEFWGPERK